ncbi:MAG: GNAT family N-acetyltransferase [Actinobacteria bacterium]|nr:GNAT family N-acetyltransferase [Actinomycetota bacterium]
MNLEINEEPISNLSVLETISIAFSVDRVLEPTLMKNRLIGIVLEERDLETPYTKDYDALDGEGTTRWETRFDLTNWGLIVARFAGSPLGGAVIAFDTKNVNMLEGRRDLAVLWDLRVGPEERGKGVGAALFKAAERWAVSHGCTELKVETQNNNVSACRFYQRQGCSLGAINRFAYPDLPHEIQLIWRKSLSK